MKDVPFTGVVVAYNEAHILPRCLASLDFCDEIIVVDLGSDDGSEEVAGRLGARVLAHERVPYRNRPLHYGIDRARNTWIVSIDPDEVFPKQEIPRIVDLIGADDGTLSGIRLPWQYYFKGSVLRTSVWGRRDASKCAVFRSDRIERSPYVHKELLAAGPDVLRLGRDDTAPIEHYWMETYRDLFEKTWRYVQGEGAMKYEVRGQRFSWFALAKHTAAGAKASFVDHRGLRGGFRGNFLSLFYTGYVLMSWLSLRHYERSLRRD